MPVVCRLNLRGRGSGIAIDACGNPYGAYVASAEVFPGSPLRSYLVKLDAQ